MSVIRGTKAQVNGLAFSPDGRRLATSGVTGTIQVWDTDTMTVARNLQGGTWCSHTVRFDPTGEKLYADIEPGLVAVYDVRTGAREDISMNPNGRDRFMVGRGGISPDAARLLGFEGKDVLIRATEGEAGWAAPVSGLGYRGSDIYFVGHSTPVAFSPTADLVAFCVRPDVLVVGVEGHAPRAQCRVEGDDPQVAFSPDGELVAATTSKFATLFRAETGEEVARADTGQRINAAAFSVTGRTLFAAGHGKMVRRWHVPSLAEKPPLAWGTGRYFALAPSPTGLIAAVADAGGRVVLWDLDDDE
jgi:WD40 repeat protein